MAIITEEPGRSYDRDKGFFLISLMRQVFYVCRLTKLNCWILDQVHILC